MYLKIDHFCVILNQIKKKRVILRNISGYEDQTYNILNSSSHRNIMR